MAMRACVKRLQKEIDQLPTHTDDSIKLIPSSSVITDWSAIIVGPPESYYEGYEFDLTIRVPAEYPLVPPLVAFKTKIFHPNVYFETGEICLDILKKEWSPAWSLHSVCRAIIAMLEEPAADSPLNCDAGNMLREGDLVAYRSMTKMYCIDECRVAQSVKS